MYTGKVKLVKNQPTIVSRDSLYLMLQPDDVKTIELMSVKGREVFWNQDHKRMTVEPTDDDDKFLVVLKEANEGRRGNNMSDKPVVGHYARWPIGNSSEGSEIRQLTEKCMVAVPVVTGAIKVDNLTMSRNTPLKLNEGLESMVDELINDKAPNLHSRYEFFNGDLIPENPRVAEKLVKILNASGEFSKCRYDAKSKTIQFMTDESVTEAKVDGDMVKKIGAIKKTFVRLQDELGAIMRGFDKDGASPDEQAALLNLSTEMVAQGKLMDRKYAAIKAAGSASGKSSDTLKILDSHFASTTGSYGRTGWYVQVQGSRDAISQDGKQIAQAQAKKNGYDPNDIEAGSISSTDAPKVFTKAYWFVTKAK